MVACVGVWVVIPVGEGVVVQAGQEKRDELGRDRVAMDECAEYIAERLQPAA